MAHAGIESDKLNNLFAPEVSKTYNKYDLLDLNIENNNKLKDTYNLEMDIESKCRNHVKYDLHDGFMVVKPHQDPNESKNMNIYTDYPYLTGVDISQSNAWY